jgi:hypothetical protein
MCPTGEIAEYRYLQMPDDEGSIISSCRFLLRRGINDTSQSTEIMTRSPML